MVPISSWLMAQEVVFIINAGANSDDKVVIMTAFGFQWYRSLRWRHNGHDRVSNHQPHHCLLNHLFRRRSKKTSKLHVTRLCAGNSPLTSEFPPQMTSNAENVSIWWRHHVSNIGAGEVCFVYDNSATGIIRCCYKKCWYRWIQTTYSCYEFDMILNCWLCFIVCWKKSNDDL